MGGTVEKRKSIKFGIDFDGTCVAHDFPRVGKSIGAQEVLRELAENGHKLILNTMRSKEYLKDAEKWFEDNDIPLYGVQKDPGQHRWTSSSKCFAHIYIDDAAEGCPLTNTAEFINDRGNLEVVEWHRPFVNWSIIRESYIKKGIIQ